MITPFDVFLSHNSRDKPAVERVAEKLKRAGLEPWFDRWCSPETEQEQIEDFKAYMDWTSDDEKRLQRQRWIDALNAGSNPFTAQEIKTLRDQ
jgi:hypothetical protein